jgi:hypothetical protein
MPATMACPKGLAKILPERPIRDRPAIRLDTLSRRRRFKNSEKSGMFGLLFI